MDWPSFLVLCGRGRRHAIQRERSLRAFGAATEGGPWLLGRGTSTCKLPPRRPRIP